MTNTKNAPLGTRLPATRHLVAPVLLATLALAAAACAARGGPGPPRAVLLDGTLNTRDLGGYETRDGRKVRWGMLFRSDELEDLDEADLLALERLGLRTVIDLRSPAEREDAPDRLPPGVATIFVPFSHPSMDPSRITSRILRGDASEGYFGSLLNRANRSFALDHGSELAQVVETLARPGMLPALFHCTYGKDRTGFVAAMVLSLVGVPWETVAEDFLLSNAMLADHIDRTAALIHWASLFRIRREEARELLGVKRAYLDSARDAVIETYGSTEAYRRAIGIDDAIVARLRDALLEPAVTAHAADRSAQ